MIASHVSAIRRAHIVYDQKRSAAAQDMGAEHALEHARVAVQVANRPPQEVRGVPHTAARALPAAKLCTGRTTLTAPAGGAVPGAGGPCDTDTPHL